MHKAFIFDLDGVLIDDETIWENKKQELYKNLLGEKIANQMGSTVGVNIDGIYRIAQSHGATIDKNLIVTAFFELAKDIYHTAPIPEGLTDLVYYLQQRNYHIGIVSASPLDWITTVTKRLSFESLIEVIISLHEREDLSNKPAPDGYVEAIRVLRSTPDKSVVLEDSNSGIASAISAGAFTIGLRQNITSGYVQQGANAYANTMQDVITLLEEKMSHNL